MAKEKAGASTQVNEEIVANEMRVVSPEGEMLGIISKEEALEKASSYGLDLVCVSPDSKPVVCKIMDYGKHLYKMKKKAKKSKKNQTVVELKELKLRPNTDTHDLLTKIKHAKKFLEDGNKVKFTVFFRGREIMFAEKALDNLNFIINELGGEENITVDLDNAVKNRRMTMLVTQKG